MRKSKLHVIYQSDLKASAGMFRATMMVDSELYQIDDDVPTVTEAKMLCFDNAGFYNPVAIFNDKGESLPIQ